jgi:peptidoglycan/LPS O-acetylase OafA/YrhL
MLVCIPFAWVSLTPADLNSFAKSLVAVPLFVSNVFFWRDGGYFETAAELKPLLHTWSLAVEEQYYVLFPLFLMLFWKLGKRWIFVSLGLVFVASIAIAQWGAYAKPTAAFFLLPTRGWELLIGAFAAFYLSQANRKDLGRITSEVAGWLGVALIMYAVFAFSKATPFPGFYALVPAIGTVLIILFATQRTTVGKFVGNKAFVGIGLISYSAYLWHQPLFAFARHKGFSDGSEYVFWFLSVLALIFAFLSWRYVESPFRSRKAICRKKVFGFAFGVTLFLILIGSAGVVSNGFERLMYKYKFSEIERTRVDLIASATNYDMYEKMATKACHIWVRNTKQIESDAFENCRNKYGKAVVVLGDSHAMNLFNIISYSDKYPFIVGVSQGGCRPHNDRSDCHYGDLEGFLSSNKAFVDLLIFHQSGSYFIKDKSGRVDSKFAFTGSFDSFDTKNIVKVRGYLSDLSQRHNLNILWIGPFLEFRWNPKEKLFSKDIYSVNPNSKILFRGLEETLTSLLRNELNFTYASYGSLFYEPVNSFEGDCFLFRDGDHYSKCGEKFIAEQMKPNFLGRFIR